MYAMVIADCARAAPGFPQFTHGTYQLPGGLHLGWLGVFGYFLVDRGLPDFARICKSVQSLCGF